MILPAFGSLTGGLDAHHPEILRQVGSNAAAYAVSLSGSEDELYGKEGGLQRLDGYWQEQDRLLEGTVEIGELETVRRGGRGAPQDPREH